MAAPTDDGDVVHHPPPPLPGATAPVKIGGLRLTTQLLGGALVAASALLPWTAQFYTSSKTAFGVPLRSLIDATPNATTGFVKLAFVLVPLAGLVIVAGLRVLPPSVGQAAGGAAALLALIFVAQLQRSMGKFYAATVFGVLGIGPYLAMLGGMIAAVSRGDQTR
jgi:hypothetical protein